MTLLERHATKPVLVLELEPWIYGWAATDGTVGLNLTRMRYEAAIATLDAVLKVTK